MNSHGRSFVQTDLLTLDYDLDAKGPQEELIETMHNAIVSP